MAFIVYSMQSLQETLLHLSLTACLGIAMAMMTCRRSTNNLSRTTTKAPTITVDKSGNCSSLETVLSVPLQKRSELILLLHNFPRSVRVVCGPTVRNDADAFGTRYTVFNKKPFLDSVIKTVSTPFHTLQLSILPEFAIKIPRTRADSTSNTLKPYTTNDLWYDLKHDYISLVKD